ncbi:hypothetical protein [Streptomyces sp. NRRL B-24720]|uniref:hypothetical protein n=1 Tax=Streptomyces sp. NRRL B-24720 TaxID=1476876 RepID=UPI000AB6C938|nr:hypothetical protein [Streptomyces sp. NRRL B-24720]
MTTLDQLIDTVLYYGPGVILTAAVLAAGRGFIWVSDRARQLLHDRAERRSQAEREFTDLIRLRCLGRLIAEAPLIQTTPGVDDDTRRQLEDLYAAPDYTREGDR